MSNWARQAYTLSSTSVQCAHMQIVIIKFHQLHNAYQIIMIMIACVRARALFTCRRALLAITSMDSANGNQNKIDVLASSRKKVKESPLFFFWRIPSFKLVPCQMKILFPFPREPDTANVFYLEIWYISFVCGCHSCLINTFGFLHSASNLLKSEMCTFKLQMHLKEK